ncbi:hypothetical protein I203_100975 [Kwoniella mangroviensis CBS 8507]|uniref:uncharacterized protein n=1 Tax=Kwoniella mangroviensis CBS 8507 TaxID=1296122 RepID=UPI003057A617
MSNLYHNTSLLLQTTYNSIHRHYSTGIEIIRRNVRPFHPPSGVLVPGLKAAYDDGHVLKAAGWTFLINLTIGSFGCITLPSMIVPTSGILMAGVRAMTWGLIFSPIAGKKDALTLPHFITMLIEAQPYILAALGDWFLTRRFISQFGWTRVEGEGQIRSIDNEENKDKKGKRTIWSWIPISWSGYGQGLKDVLSLYGPITGILAIAAMWEGYEVIHFKKGFW